MYIIYRFRRTSGTTISKLQKTTFDCIIRQKNRMSVNAQQVGLNKNLSTRGCREYVDRYYEVERE